MVSTPKIEVFLMHVFIRISLGLTIICGCTTSSDNATTGDTRHPVDTPAESNFCTGGVAALYEPLAGDRLDSLPDDFYTNESATPTGIRVSFHDAGWLSALPESYSGIYRDVEGLDGWGLNAGIHLRFDQEVTFPSDTTGQGGAIGLYALESGMATPIPFEVRSVSDGKSAIFFPLIPLAEGTQHALVIRADALAPEIDCIRASDTLQSLLNSTANDPKLTALNTRYRDVLNALSLQPDEVGAAVVFTTQTVTAPSVAAAADVAARQMKWTNKPTCDAPANERRRCVGTYTGYDYRDNNGTFGSEPTMEWTMEVDIHLPAGPGPFPIVVFGHGIIDDRESALASADILVPLGIALVAIDAPHHGKHPTATSGGTDPIDAALGLLGADLDNLSLNTVEMRNNFRQAASDKLQMLQLLEQNPDIDGDEAPDLNFDQIGYHGVSLGGIMGPEFLALRGDIDIALLAVPGGRLSTLFADSEIMSLFLVLLQSVVEDKSDADRLLPVAQTSIDPGDPATWGVYAMQQRLNDAPPPSLLMMMAYEDETIPTSATHALARAMNLPVVEPMVVDPYIVGTVAPPVSSNLGAATGGLFQFDRVRQAEDADIERAKHNTTPFSLEARYQAEHFFQTWLTNSTPEIINPYAVLNTPID